MIQAENIHKSYGKLHVLKGLNLFVQRGEVISIMGASGAGKSTLLHILGTLDKQDSGKLVIDGQEPASLDNRQLARFRNSHIGFVFQFHHLLPEFTALENVCIPGMIAGREDSELKTRAKELLDFLGLAERMTHKPAQLSGGEQQRVAVARALINRPGIVLADEPSGNLDTHNSRELHHLFFKLREQFGQTFVIATHNEELAGMADRQLHMADGVFTETEQTIK
jgi:lipoprotein-releasing system ATP-binding protein